MSGHFVLRNMAERTLKTESVLAQIGVRPQSARSPAAEALQPTRHRSWAHEDPARFAGFPCLPPAPIWLGTCACNGGTSPSSLRPVILNGPGIVRHQGTFINHLSVETPDRLAATPLCRWRWPGPPTAVPVGIGPCLLTGWRVSVGSGDETGVVGVGFIPAIPVCATAPRSEDRRVVS